MTYKAEIGNLKPGTWFYFPNDPELILWQRINDFRRDSAGRKFIYCENELQEVQDYQESREVMAFYDNKKGTPEKPVYKKEPAPVIIHQPAVIKQPSLPSFVKHHIINMEHSISKEVIVYQTSNYKLFEKLKSNRKINKTKVNKIIKEIKSGNDMLCYYPLQVQENATGKLNILDGQHRFEIDQILKRPVYYFLVGEKKSMSEIAKVNSNVEKWKAIDYINCYI